MSERRIILINCLSNLYDGWVVIALLRNTLSLIVASSYFLVLDPLSHWQRPSALSSITSSRPFFGCLAPDFVPDLRNGKKGSHFPVSALHWPSIQWVAMHTVPMLYICTARTVGNLGWLTRVARAILRYPFSASLYSLRTTKHRSRCQHSVFRKCIARYLCIRI